MSTIIDNAKAKWKEGANYDDMSVDDTTMIGIEADGNIFVVGKDQGVSTASVVGGVIITKTDHGPEFKLTDSAAVMRVSSGGEIGGIDTVDVAIFEAHADAELSVLYAGAGFGYTLAGGSASIFDFNLGVGLSTGAGLKDESVELKLAGTGVTIGRKISISVLDVSFGIDLVRTTHAVWFVGKELAVAVALVPGALEDGGSALLQELKDMPDTFGDAGSDLWTSVKQIPGAFAAIPGAFADAGSQLGGLAADGAKTVAGGVVDGAEAVVDGAKTVAGGVSDGAKAVADGAEKAVDGAVDTAKSVFHSLNPFD